MGWNTPTYRLKSTSLHTTKPLILGICFLQYHKYPVILTVMNVRTNIVLHLDEGGGEGDVSVIEKGDKEKQGKMLQKKAGTTKQ